MQTTEDKKVDSLDGRGIEAGSALRDGWSEAIRASMVGRNFGRMTYGRLRGDYDIVELRTRNSATKEGFHLPWKPLNGSMEVNFSDDVEDFRFTVATLRWIEWEGRVVVSIVPDVYRRIMDDADRGGFIVILNEIEKSMPSVEFVRGFGHSWTFQGKAENPRPAAYVGQDPKNG